MAAHPAPKEGGNAIVIGARQTFHSTILGEDRTILVHTPASYENGKAVYPVLYVLDGEEYFHHTTGITTFLSKSGRAPEMLVVGVTNTGDSRDRDLTRRRSRIGRRPAAPASSWPSSKEELRPHIEGAYRTAPHRAPPADGVVTGRAR